MHPPNHSSLSSCPLQDHASAFLGTSGAPSPAAVATTLASLLAVNSLIYSFLMHALYAILLRGMGYDLGPMPGLAGRLLPTAPGLGTR